MNSLTTDVDDCVIHVFSKHACSVFSKNADKCTNSQVSLCDTMWNTLCVVQCVIDGGIERLVSYTSSHTVIIIFIRVYTYMAHVTP